MLCGVQGLAATHRDLGISWGLSAMVIFNLHRRQLPTNILEDKARDYVIEGLVTQDEVDGMLAVIRSERGESGVANDGAEGDDDGPGQIGAPRRLTRDELHALLAERVRQMEEGGGSSADQFMIYTFIIEQLGRTTAPLRLMVQAYLAQSRY